MVAAAREPGRLRYRRIPRKRQVYVRVIIEVGLPSRGFGTLGRSARRREAARDAAMRAADASGAVIDDDFGPVPLRVRPYASVAARVAGAVGSAGVPVRLEDLRALASDRQETWVVRADITDVEKTAGLLRQQAQVMGVFTDPLVGPFVGPCCDDDPVGDEESVRAALGVTTLEDEGLAGDGVRVAVVDTGFNVDAVRAKGRGAPFRSDPGSTLGCPASSGPGRHPDHEVHGGMCAYQVGLAAPAATLMDFGFLGSQPNLEAYLTDALTCFLDLRDHLDREPGALVVTNSWGVLDPSEDASPGDEDRYLDNPDHLFNLAVGNLEAGGADIVFAAGNCGASCPDPRCRFRQTPTICGANSHPSVLTVGGASTTGAVVGYSSAGPGAIADEKPDVLAYCHFAGFYAPGADSGTSAAAPLAGGVIAAVRSRWGPKVVAPAALRQLIRATAAQEGDDGFRCDSGWGIIRPQRLLQALKALDPS
jgi:hypothetical protein